MTTPSSAALLAKLRADIANLDQKLIQLLRERKTLSVAIGQVKKSAQLPVRDQGQEQRLYAKLEAVAKDQGLEPALVSAIYRIIIEDSVKAQESL